MKSPKNIAASADRRAKRRQEVIDRRTGLARRQSTAISPEASEPSAEGAAVDNSSVQDSALSAAPDQQAPIEDNSMFSGELASLDTNLERRRGPGRRRTDFMKAADEGEMTQEQFMFVMAIDAFKRVNGRTFPTWTEVLEVIRKLGYRKTTISELNLGKQVEDWTEAANAPAGVFKQSADDLANPATRRLI